MLRIGDILDRVTGIRPRPKKGMDPQDEVIYDDVLVRLTDGALRTFGTEDATLVPVSAVEREIISAEIPQLIAGIAQRLATTNNVEAVHVRIDMHPAEHPDAVEVSAFS